MRCTAAVALVGLLLLASSSQAADTKIKHIVVLMQENRSFDHLLGFLTRLNPEIRGLTGNETNPLNPLNPNSVVYQVSDDSGYVTDPDPGHGVGDVTEQSFGGEFLDDNYYPAPMNGFVRNYENRASGRGHEIMRSFSPEALPVSTEMVTEFGVIDDWFCSVPGPTMPNRYYLLSASSNGVAENSVLPIIVGFPQRTVFDLIEEANMTWASYFHEAPTPLAFKNTRKEGARDRFFHFNTFAEHLAEGRLATLTHIDPLYYGIPRFPPNDDHPDHDVSLGQALFKEVYDLLRATPMWEETLLLITYDEHGGFYDHVPVPIDVPNPDGLISDDPPCDFDRLGPRVPAILVSPWIERGLVEHEPPGPFDDSHYDHASLAATIRSMFDLPNPLNERDAWAGAFNHLWANRTEPRTDTPLVMPDPVKLPAMKKINGREPTSHLQQELVYLVAGLNADYDVRPEEMNVIQASMYIQQQVNIFFGKNMYPEHLLWENHCRGKSLIDECTY